MSKVSIIIPTYNSQATISETLNSLKEQTADPRIHSIVIADDCSKDNTIGVCQTYAIEEKKLKIFSSPQNQGERRNINRILNYLQEQEVDWFMILHSDDLAKPTWIKENLDRMETASTKTASICSSWDNWYPDLNEIKTGENKIELASILIEGSKASVIDTFRSGCWWHVSGCSIRVKAFEELGGFGPNLPQLGDFEWLLRALSSGWNIEYIPRSLILYRQHTQSVSSNSFRNDLDIKEFLGILRSYLYVLNYSSLLFLWRSKLVSIVRRLFRSILRRDLDLIKKRLFTLFLLNKYFIYYLFFKFFKLPNRN